MEMYPRVENKSSSPAIGVDTPASKGGPEENSSTHPRHGNTASQGTPTLEILMYGNCTCIIKRWKPNTWRKVKDIYVNVVDVCI